MPVGDYSLGRAVLDLVTDPAGIRTGLSAARAESVATLGSISKTLQAAGTQISQTGQKLTIGITAPVIAAGAAIIKTGVDFETTLNQIVGLTDVTRDQIGGIKTEILAMGQAIGKSPQELAEAFYFVASAGFTAAEAMQVLRTAATASAAGLGTTQDVAKVLGLTLNAYGHENITAAHAADVLVAAVKDGTAEADAFAGVLGRVIPTAATLRVSFDQVTAALAGMTLTGLSADEAATSLNQVLVSLLKPTSEAEKTMAELGLSAAGLRQELKDKGLLATLRTLEQAFGANEEAAAKVFGNVRALRGVLALLGLDEQQLNKVFADTAKAQGDLAEGYSETEGHARAFARSQAEIDAALIQLSEDVLPAVADLLHEVADAIQGAARWFRSLPPDVRRMVVEGLALVAALGPLLVVVGSLTSALGGLAGILSATLIPLLVGGLNVAIGGVATLIFATGVPALEALAVGLVGVEIAAGPLVVTLAAVAGAIALMKIQSDNRMRDLVEDVGRLQEAGKLTAEAWDQAVTIARISGKSAVDLRQLVDAWIAQDKAQRAVVDSADLVVKAEHAASERADELGPVVRGLGDAYTDNGEKVADYAQAVKFSLGEALDTQEAYTSDALDAMQKFRKELEGVFGAAQDALFDTAETAAKITLKSGELTAVNKELTAALKKGDKEAIASTTLKRIGILKELNELKLHSALIGTDIEQTTKLNAILTSKEMKDGLTSKYPEVKAAHEALRDSILASLQTIVVKGGPAALAAAKAIRAQLDPKLGTSPLAGSRAWGYATTEAFMLGAAAAVRDYYGDVHAAISRVASLMMASSPPGPESPLHLVDVWGGRTGDAWGDPFVDRLEAVASRIRRPLSAIGAQLAGGFMPRDLSLAGAAGALGRTVPSLPSDAGAPGVAGGGNTYSTTLIMPGRPTRDPLEALHRAERYQRFGVINPPVEMPLEEGTVNA